MNLKDPSLKRRINDLNRDDIIESLSKIKRGIEKESLRCDFNGILALTPQPKALGSSLTHPFITTDYSESLLEFVTPPTLSMDELFNRLTNLHQYTYTVLQDEILWNASMPCRLPPENEIPIAEYGTSNVGQLKKVYRLGLGLRYGRRMQMISGIHYNFSYPLAFWKQYAELKKETSPSSPAFISAQYLGLIRNAQRMGWILPYLFGASPAVCSSFFQGNAHTFEFNRIHSHTYFLPEATSLRVSDLGYQNKSKAFVNVSYNSFPEFLTTMHQAVHTPHPVFERLGVKKNGQYQQLSGNVLQIEDEHYSTFRPKRVTSMDERMLFALQRDGIEYIEIRAFDLNPFLPLGISKQTIYFMDIFITLCVLLDSPPMSEEEEIIIRQNHAAVVKAGRHPRLTLIHFTGGEITLKEWANILLSSMENIAEILDRSNNTHLYSDALNHAKACAQDPDTLPSAKILSELQNTKESYLDLMIRLSKQHRHYFQDKELQPMDYEYYKALANTSILEQNNMERSDSLPFDDFLANFLKA